ncbi:MAG: sugar transferase [Actinomycetota bacterium]|nr:sugar transferase [Actinomycetota bacterium]
MTPPVQELEAPRSALRTSAAGAAAAAQERSAYVVAGDIVSLTDVWILLAVLWVSRFVTGNLDPAVALFGLLSFVFVLAPNRDRGGKLSAGALTDAGHIFRRVWIAYAVASGVSIAVGIGDLKVLLAVAVGTAPLLLAGRGVSYGIERNLRAKTARARTLIVGGGDIARRVVNTLDAHREYGLEVVGAVDDDPKFNADELGTRTIGGLEDIPNIVESHKIQVVLVAFSAASQHGMVDVIRGAMAAGATVWVVPRFFELGAADTGGDHLWGLPVMRLQAPARSRPEWIMKRTIDFVVAAVGVVLISPLLALLALLTLIETGRPILLKQTRVGLDGKAFEILKFRTMKVGGQAEGTEWAADEARMTKIGKILRKTSLDELPQLFNVLKGDMSLVGPRPERPYFVDLFSDLYPSYNARHRLPAGITGWAQVHGLRGDTSIEERAAFDNYYIENWSLAQDLKILMRTALAMVSRGR